MPQLTQVPFVLSTGSGYSGKSNASLLRNMFISVEEAGAKSNYIIMNTDGSLRTAEADSQIYGIYEFAEELYAITADSILLLNRPDGDFTAVASVEISDMVVIADNGIDMMIVDGTKGYAFNPSTQELKDMETEEGWYPSSTVAYMDGYFIFNRDGTGQFFISKIYSTELDPIDWATGENAPDDTVAVYVSNRVLWIMGERSLEAWYNSGDANFPFTRISGGTVDIGVATARGVSKIRDRLFFVGNDFRVYMVQGYTPTPISTPSIEKFLNSGNTELISSFTYSSEGHWFFVIHLNNDLTYVYDVSTGFWHTRTTGYDGKWFIEGAMNRASFYAPVAFSGKNLYSLSIDHFLDDETPIKREMISLPLNNTVNRFTIAETILDMEVAQKVDGEIALYTSQDGGRTWSNRYTSTLGATGMRLNRVRWLRLGQYRDCTFKVVTFIPASIRVIGLHVRIGR